MFFFLIYFIFIFFFLEIIDIDNLIILKNYYITIFSLFLTFNYLFINMDGTNYKEKINFDLIFKFFYIFFKNPSFFLNYLFNTVKKIILYLFSFKYYNIYVFIKLYLLKYSYLFLFWRPLFKKSSYFGYYRSNRSKWIK